jgi:hypothetical protein
MFQVCALVAQSSRPATLLRSSNFFLVPKKFEANFQGILVGPSFVC